MKGKTARFLLWCPRILSILFAVFLSTFALDVFGEGGTFLQTTLALLVHLIPSAIVVAVLLLAWRWEWVGALLYAAAATIYSLRVLPAHVSWALVIGLPLLVIAAMFLFSWLEHSEPRTAQ